jgi:3-oxoacyl-[acyl-carrier protein] reductase
MRALSGMSVLVTGGGSGIGAGTARHLVAGGARVTICGRRPDKIAAVAEEIGEGCRAVVADITQANDRAHAVAEAVEHGGGLDALVNNAGNMLRGNIDALDESELLNLFHTNVVGGMLLTGLCVPALADRKGAVVFLGSVHTRRAFPGASAYAASKGAVSALTQVLAAELGPQEIRVNCVIPGAVFTEINQRAGLFDDAAALERLTGMASLHALGRIGTEEEVAEAIDYLIRSEWTTGAVLDVDGGLGLGVTRDA